MTGKLNRYEGCLCSEDKRCLKVASFTGARRKGGDGGAGRRGCQGQPRVTLTVEQEHPDEVTQEGVQAGWNVCTEGDSTTSLGSLGQALTPSLGTSFFSNLGGTSCVQSEQEGRTSRKADSSTRRAYPRGRSHSNTHHPLRAPSEPTFPHSAPAPRAPFPGGGPFQRAGPAAILWWEGRPAACACARSCACQRRRVESAAMGLGQNAPVRVEWIAAVSLAAGAAAVGYLAYKKFLSKDKCCKAMVNPSVQKDNPKVVHAFDVEDLGDKAVYCRCWRSKKFPLCDGSHIKHNEETGDNVGPLIIKRKEA